eukprot:324741-Prorocentrum_minimum.AAC.1
MRSTKRACAPIIHACAPIIHPCARHESPMWSPPRRPQVRFITVFRSVAAFACLRFLIICNFCVFWHLTAVLTTK